MGKEVLYDGENIVFYKFIGEQSDYDWYEVYNRTAYNELFAGDLFKRHHLALANAIYEDLGLGWLPYPENKPEKGVDYNVTFLMDLSENETVSLVGMDNYRDGWVTYKRVTAFRPPPEPYKALESEE